MGAANGLQPVAEGASPPARRGKPRPPAVCYLGFRTTADGREYSLRVSDGLEPRFFVLLIRHQVFAAREARFQDAPDLCFARLQRDLAADPDLIPGPRLVLTAEELREYRNARERRPPVRKRAVSAG
jgi:hypothetical protein